MCTPQVALRAMPLTAGQDFWLYRGLLSRLQLMACGARLAAAADGDANDRHARPLPSRRERGTGAIRYSTYITGKNCRHDAFSGGSDILN